MDGQRLRLTGGTYGTANSTYQTEIANFVTVEAYGASGSGPSFWVATAKNGWRYTYGGGGTTSNAAVPSISGNSDSTVVSWQLSEVTDTYGNSMTVTYSTNNANAQVVPSVISWVPASAGSDSISQRIGAFGRGRPCSSRESTDARSNRKPSTCISVTQ